MTYAFVFDASACSGCKACQIACKDKNNLPTGVLWRRVYEISGGSWTNVGAGSPRPGVWETDVFAYNLSIACNHCVHPKCAGVCPTDAYVVRSDGIVYIDETKCIGCGYCNWACPYSAPSYNPELRYMTKCNFCMDNIDVGLPPACVAACPMRVLDFVSLTPGSSPEFGRGVGERALWEVPGTEHPYPLPEYSRTEPHLAITPHMGMVNGLEKAISNQEEVEPQKHEGIKISWLGGFVVKGFEEFSLVIFTLCGQMAAGMAVFSLFGGPLSIPLLATIGGLIGLGGLASLLHLGTPLNAWRALNHLKKSWLSREILMFGLFGASWLISLVMPGMGKLPLALCGLGLVYSMGQVYRFKAVPAWNTWRTNVAFFLSAGVLGLTGVAFGAGLDKTWFPLWVLLAAEAAVAVLERHPVHETARRVRVGLILLGMAGAWMLFGSQDLAREWNSIPTFLIILMEEMLGRWLFYESKVKVM
jgi:anaerobic dimethyl sulfoxide reductase subunit B (iron-sulfur subunit)